MTEQISILGQTSTAVQALLIKSEEDAWLLLEKLQSEDFLVPEDLVIDNWFHLHFHLDGAKFDSSITPSLFPVFHAFQKAIYQTYAEAKYGEKTTRLTNDEKDQLEIIIRVTPGSSNLSSWFDFSKLGPECLKKMTKKQVFILLLSAAVLLGGTTAYSDYLESKKDARILELTNQHEKQLLEHFHFAGEQETKRMEMMVSMVQKNESIRTLYEASEKLQEEKLKVAAKADHSEISGVSLDKAVAEQLTKNKRERPEPTRIDGIFQVLKLDWDNPEFAQITLKRTADDLIIAAKFNVAYFSDEEKSIIKNAEWDESGLKLLKANINARFSRGRIVDAELMRVSGPDQNDIEPSAN